MHCSWLYLLFSDWVSAFFSTLFDLADLFSPGSYSPILVISSNLFPLPFSKSMSIYDFIFEILLLLVYSIFDLVLAFIFPNAIRWITFLLAWILAVIKYYSLERPALTPCGFIIIYFLFAISHAIYSFFIWFFFAVTQFLFTILVFFNLVFLFYKFFSINDTFSCHSHQRPALTPCGFIIIYFLFAISHASPAKKWLFFHCHFFGRAAFYFKSNSLQFKPTWMLSALFLAVSFVFRLGFSIFFNAI